MLFLRNFLTLLCKTFSICRTFRHPELPRCNLFHTFYAPTLDMQFIMEIICLEWISDSRISWTASFDQTQFQWFTKQGMNLLRPFQCIHLYKFLMHHTMLIQTLIRPAKPHLSNQCINSWDIQEQNTFFSLQNCWHHSDTMWHPHCCNVDSFAIIWTLLCSNDNSIAKYLKQSRKSCCKIYKSV